VDIVIHIDGRTAGVAPDDLDLGAGGHAGPLALVAL
jgi:hypothetical protein